MAATKITSGVIGSNSVTIDKIPDSSITEAKWGGGQLGGRNIIINGAMQVAQRANRSPSGFTGSFYAGPDRWLVNRTGTGSTGFSQISSTSYGATNAAQATFDSAAGETYIVTQRIESANVAYLAGQNVTLSFWISGSTTAGSTSLNAALSYADSVDDFTSETIISTNSVSYTGSAQKFTFNYTLPANAANGIAVRFEGTQADATGTFTLTFGGVQLEVGDTATPFEHENYPTTLAKCQRYYQRLVQPGDYTDTISATVVYRAYPCVVTMRPGGTGGVLSQLSYWSGGSATPYTPNAVSNVSGHYINITATGLTSARGFVSGFGEVYMDAEL